MSETHNLIDTLDSDGKFSTFVRVLKSSKADQLITGAGPFTVFAPTNDAFGKVPDAQMDKWLNQPDQADLAKVLSYHVLPAKVFATKLGSEGPATTLNGQEVVFDTTNGLKVNISGVQARNIEATNGIIHALDTVLTPAAKQMAATASGTGTASTTAPISISPAPQNAQTDGHSETPPVTAESPSEIVPPPITPAIS